MLEQKKSRKDKIVAFEQLAEINLLTGKYEKAKVFIDKVIENQKSKDLIKKGYI